MTVVVKIHLGYMCQLLVYARNTATYHFTVTGLGLLDGRSLRGEDDSVVNYVYLYHCFHCNLVHWLVLLLLSVSILISMSVTSE